MQLIDFALGAFASNEHDEGRFVDSIPIAAGQGAMEVRCVHIMPGKRPPERIDGGVLGELPNGHDHLFLVLQGRGRVSGGTSVRAPIETGQAAYFPKDEGYLIFADTPLTGMLIKGGGLELTPRAMRTVGAS